MGPDVVLDVRNSGPTVHNVTIRDDGGAILGATRDLREGEAESITAALPDGTYVMNGNRGQYVFVVPSRRVILVRRGFDGGGARFDEAKWARDMLAALGG